MLAGITISTLGGENGLLTKTKLAQIEYEKTQAKEELQLKITTMQMKIVDEEVRTATLEDFDKLIIEDEELTFISATYKTSTIETNGEEYETIKVLYNDYIFTVDESLVITSVEENTNMANVDLNYEIKDITEVDGKTIYKVLITLKSNEKIVKVEYGEQLLKSDSGIEEIAIDFEAEKSEEYNLKITTSDGREVEKTFIIDKEIITGVELNKTSMYLGIGKEEILQFNVLPSDALYESVEWTTSDETIATVDKNGKVTANSKDEGTVTVTVTVKAFEQTYTAECVVMVIDDVEISGYIIDISGIQGGNSSAINEIELYNSEDVLLTEHYLDGVRGDATFYNFSIDAYDSRTAELPAYWNRGPYVWGKENLFDGSQNYNEYTTTTFNSWGNSSEECWARLFIYNLSEDVNKIKIYSGGTTIADGGRYPVELSVYKVTGYRTQIVNENLKTKDNDSEMTLWETQQVSTDKTVIAENIFVKP